MKMFSHQKVKEQSDNLRTKISNFSAILERIPDMDLKEILKVFVVMDPVRRLLKLWCYHIDFQREDKDLDQVIEESINEVRTRNAELAGILEKIHNMNIKDTAIGILGIDAMESLLKLRMLVILQHPNRLYQIYKSWFSKENLIFNNIYSTRIILYHFAL